MRGTTSSGEELYTWKKNNSNLDGRNGIQKYWHDLRTKKVVLKRQAGGGSLTI